MLFFKDVLPILKKHEITFEKSFRESGNIYTFVFRSDEKIKWNAGQHGAFIIKHEKIKKSIRAFSIASTDRDEYIEISTRVGDKPSEYKQALMNLKPGVKMNMRGPIGGFYLHNDKPTLMIAGGIGITPYKSIIKDIMASSNNYPQIVHLLYIDSKEEFIYQQELNKASNDNGVIIDYIKQREDLSKSIETFISKYENDANYFIAGSPQMIKSITALLRQHNIKNKNIIKDSFIGY
ncbi:MAG TPA: FAD-dependent oxidoreductase [Anaerovoracaceae bacterium]|nr:FAD-dependent oxidoreductase [Anaerovoracaceae bacterium]